MSAQRDRPAPPPPLAFGARIAFAWIAFFRILFDGAYAARLFAARDARGPAEREPRLPAARAEASAATDEDEAEAPTTSGVKTKKPSTNGAEAEEAAPRGALQLLAVLQREGRLVDFLQQDIAAFSDADVGAAARVVHDGARKALQSYVTLAPVRDEEEGAKVEIEKGSPAIKLTGNVGGAAPYRGVLRHKGWRATDVKLPTPVAGHDAHVVAPAEVEL